MIRLRTGSKLAFHPGSWEQCYRLVGSSALFDYLQRWHCPYTAACGHRPNVEEAITRLQLLRGKGPHSEAFTFRELYPPPDAPATEQPGGFEDECPAT